VRRILVLSQDDDARVRPLQGNRHNRRGNEEALQPRERHRTAPGGPCDHDAIRQK
jgi:hypothetical protein